MPELPEVETVRAGLERHVLGRTVATAKVLNPRAVRRDPAGPAGFTAAMIGRTFTSAAPRQVPLARPGRWLCFCGGTAFPAWGAPAPVPPGPRTPR